MYNEYFYNEHIYNGIIGRVLHIKQVITTQYRKLKTITSQYRDIRNITTGG